MKTKTWVAVLVLAVVVAAGGFGYQLWLQNQAEQRVAEVAALLEKGDRPVQVEYGEVEVGWSPMPVIVHDVAVALGDEAPTLIEKFTVADYATEDGLATALHVRAEGIAQDLSDLGEEQATLLRKLGYNTMRGAYEMAYDYDPDQQVLELKQLRADVEDMAGIGLELRLSDFDLESAVRGGAQAYPEFKVDKFAITYRDASLVRRLIREAAKEQGVSEEEFVAQLLLDVEAQAGDDRLMQQLAQELRSFLKDPQQLTISGEPEQAVAVMEVMAAAMLKPDELPQMLNLQVKAN